MTQRVGILVLEKKWIIVILTWSSTVRSRRDRFQTSLHRGRAMYTDRSWARGRRAYSYIIVSIWEGGAWLAVSPWWGKRGRGVRRVWLDWPITWLVGLVIGTCTCVGYYKLVSISSNFEIFVLNYSFAVKLKSTLEQTKVRSELTLGSPIVPNLTEVTRFDLSWGLIGYRRSLSRALLQLRQQSCVCWTLGKK